MKTPSVTDLLVFVERYNFFLDCETARIPPVGERVCKKCGTRIRGVRAAVSLHAIGFGVCAGQGRVWPVPIPYCPKCEPRPEACGCLHVPYEMLRMEVPQGLIDGMNSDPTMEDS